MAAFARWTETHFCEGDLAGAVERAGHVQPQGQV